MGAIMSSTESRRKLELLIDGSLDLAEKNQWLRSLDEDSPVWREIAIGFLEHQVLDQALNDPIQLTTNLPGEKSAAPGLQDATRTSSRSRPRLMWWMALGACVLLGWSLGSQPLDPSPSATNDDFTGQLQSPSESSLDKTGRLPLADALARSVQPVSVDTRRAFLKAGYILKERQQLADVELPTGDSIKLPIRQFDVRYLGNATFQ